jgi:hypothetical protein
LKEKDEVPGCPKGEHVCMHRGQLVKEKAILNELFIIETISDFEIISGGRISFGKKRARLQHFYWRQNDSPTGTANEVLTLSFGHLVAVH